jgi:cysteine desulfuration protein SufE
MSIPSLDQLQADILLEIGSLEGNAEKMMRYLVEQGRNMAPLSEADKTEEYRLHGCQSNVWIKSYLENGRVHFLADSNTLISKGLLQLLMRLLNGQSPEIILQADLYLLREPTLQRFIGTTRNNGLAAMEKRMKACAWACLVLPTTAPSF